jgi:hypothetical protein
MIYDFLDPAKRPTISPHWNTLEAFKQINSQSLEDLTLSMLAEPDKIPLIAYGKKEVAVIPINEYSNPNDWYVIGDLHGDFFAFSNQLHWIKTNNPNFKLIFLGDLIDRGPHPLEVLKLMLQTIHDYPNRVLWIAGNHDEAIYLNDKGEFSSSVLPAEFTDTLNQKDDHTEIRQRFGVGFIEISNRLPRAAVFPDGLLVTHGGFPLTDLQSLLTPEDTIEQKIAWLNSSESLQDFTWTRITDWPKKIPNRTTKGCSYGFKDFAAFCESSKGLFNSPIERLLTGHEHPSGGYDKHVTWVDHPAITLKGFGFYSDYDQPQAYATKYDKELVIGQLFPNQMPEVIKIPVIEKDLFNFFVKASMCLPQFANPIPSKE